MSDDGERNETKLKTYRKIAQNLHLAEAFLPQNIIYVL